jgi:hypothetical protein
LVWSRRRLSLGATRWLLHMLMPLWWAVVGLSYRPCRGRGIYIVQLIKSNRVDIKVALYCELKSTLGKRWVAEYPPGARNVWFWRRRPDRQDSYGSPQDPRILYLGSVRRNIPKIKDSVNI